ncbi:guanylate kinase [Actinomycetota bacterium]|nr:guanylate kinase [Actinomycetota bacterium]
MPEKGNLFIISGPSGVGKGTLVAAVLQRLENIQVSISATTRLPRLGDIPDQSYHFFSDQQFDEMISTDGFLEWAVIHGQRYGTLMSEVNKILKTGNDMILEIDIQGNNAVKAKMPEAISIFIAPPNMQELENRLRNRHSEDDLKIKQRLKTAELEIESKDGYNVVIVNEDLDAAINELVSLISGYRLKN